MAHLLALLRDGHLFLFFVEQFPFLLTTAWGQAGWLLGEKVSEGAYPGLHIRPWGTVGAQEMGVLIRPS